MKERTSSRLSDLLKKSPVKLFRENTDLSTAAHQEHHQSHAHSVVGRRLSDSYKVNTDQTHVYDRATNSAPSSSANTSGRVSNTQSNELISNTGSLSTLVADYEEEEGENPECQSLQIEIPGDSDCKSCDHLTPPLPLRLSHYPIEGGGDRNSSISLTSTNGDTLERSGTSKQGYSTDNLADVEENDYENVDYGDNETFHADMTTREPIYDTVTNIKTLEDSHADTDIPPALPPLPEFLLKKRLVKTTSVSGGITPEPSQYERADSEMCRRSLPCSLKLNKPASDFWVALEKYIETGNIDKPANNKNLRPMRHSETSMRNTLERDEDRRDDYQ